MGDSLDISLVGRTASTNALALEAARDGAPSGTVYVADRQTAGRGRRETGGDRRRWFSPGRQNLYLSVLLRPEISVDRASAITIAVGVELVDVLRELTGVDVELKWPNDLYVQDKKLAGILTEAITGTDGLEAVVVGVGINVNVQTVDFPDELQGEATSLSAETGERYDRLSLALSVSEAIARSCRRYVDGGLEPFSDRLQRWDYLRGRQVSIADNKKSRAALARGIGERGGLVVEFSDGRRTEVVSGEVTIEDF